MSFARAEQRRMDREKRKSAEAALAHAMQAPGHGGRVQVRVDLECASIIERLLFLPDLAEKAGRVLASMEGRDIPEAMAFQLDVVMACAELQAKGRVLNARSNEMASRVKAAEDAEVAELRALGERKSAGGIILPPEA